MVGLIEIDVVRLQARRESSAARSMYDFESPFFSRSISLPTFVAITTLALFPLSFIHFPMIVSDSPPLFPGTHVEYESAVSTQLNPDARNASSRPNAPGSSTVHPKTLPPNIRGAISSPEFPRVRRSIALNPSLQVSQCMGIGDPGPPGTI